MRERIFIHRFEFVTALGVLLWGVWLLNPFVDSFTRFPSLTEMSKHATEAQWGGAAVLIGVAGIFGLLRDNKDIRRAAMLFALAFRMFTLLFTGLQNHFASQGIPDFFLWAMIALTAYMRIDRDA